MSIFFSGTILPTTNTGATNVSAPPPYYSYAPPAMTAGSGSQGAQQGPTGNSYNFSYAAGTPPVASSEYTYAAAVQDTREAGCYNMVYFPPNPTTGKENLFLLHIEANT